MSALDDAKARAPKLTHFGETQFIVGSDDDYEVITLLAGIGTFTKIGGKPVVARRSWQATDYVHDHQGAWIDQE